MERGTTPEAARETPSAGDDASMAEQHAATGARTPAKPPRRAIQPLEQFVVSAPQEGASCDPNDPESC